MVLNKPRSSVQVTLQDGRTFAGVVEDADVGSDLATVRIQASGLPTMKVNVTGGIHLISNSYIDGSLSVPV